MKKVYQSMIRSRQSNLHFNSPTPQTRNISKQPSLETKRSTSPLFEFNPGQSLKFQGNDYQTTYGFVALAQLQQKRLAAAKKVKYPSQKSKIQEYQKTLKQVEKLLSQKNDALNATTRNQLIEQRTQLEKKIKFLTTPPVLEYQISNAQNQPSKTLGERLFRKVQQYIESGELGYQAPVTLKDNKGFVDERLALWEVVLEFLHQPKKTPSEDEAMDLGLYLLNNFTVNTGNNPDRWSGTDRRETKLSQYDSQKKLASLWPKELNDLISKDPSQMSLHEAYLCKFPTASEWEKITKAMLHLKSEYAKSKYYDDSRIKHLQWENSPAGRAAKAEEDREFRERHDRLQRERDERQSYLDSIRDDNRWDPHRQS
jgi:hypothetical protein